VTGVQTCALPISLLEVLDAYEQAENLRISRIEQDFAAREAAAEGALLYGATQ
jgi:hypothetical protein